MGVDRSVKEAHNHNAILKASQEHPGDQVVQLAIFCGAIVACLQKGVQSGTRIVVRKGFRWIWTSNTANMIVSRSVKSLCSA